MPYTVTLGTVSHGTMRNEDLLPDFTWLLEQIGSINDAALVAECNKFLDLAGADETGETWSTETAHDMVIACFDALDAHAPAYCYFGAHEGDGSDFGFWPSWDSIDELPKFNDLADVPADIDDDYVVVNDHGNVSLYGANGALIWDCV